MTKDDVADALDEIGTLLELKGENAFKCNAYHNGARAIRQLPDDLAEVVAVLLRESHGITRGPRRRNLLCDARRGARREEDDEKCREEVTAIGTHDL